MINEPTPFGILIRQLRTDKKLTLRQLGEKTHVWLHCPN